MAVKAGGEIPPEVRAAVDDRDQFMCRCCGAYTSGARQQHHIVFGGTARGMGGKRVHNVDEIISLCLACHLRVHRDKHRWAPLLLEAVNQPSMTAMAIERWRRAAGRLW